MVMVSRKFHCVHGWDICYVLYYYMLIGIEKSK